MARVYYTTSNLVSEVRNLLSETNVDAVSDSVDILPALNRGQEYAFDIYARRYPEPLLKYTTLTPTADTAEYEIPEDAFEDRILKLEVAITGNTQNSYVQIRRISFRDISEYESTTSTSVPNYYTVVGRRIRIIPTPNGVYNFRLWYLREPTRLVATGGRITNINSGSNYINIDALEDTDISSDSTQKGSYINIINGQTGEIRGQMQIQSISGTKVVFRSSPVQATVFGSEVLSAIPDTTELDDYICISSGTCVPFYGSPTGNFLVQFAVAEITRKLGGQAMQEEQILQKFENQVMRTWSGREVTMRVQKNNPIWGTAASSRRLYPTTNR